MKHLYFIVTVLIFSFGAFSDEKCPLYCIYEDGGTIDPYHYYYAEVCTTAGCPTVRIRCDEFQAVPGTCRACGGPCAGAALPVGCVIVGREDEEIPQIPRLHCQQN